MENTIFNIAVDCGKFNAKFAYRVLEEMKTGVLRTSMREGHDNFGRNYDVHQVVIDEKKYTIGDATDSFSDDNIELKKSSDLHKFVTLTAICKALKDAGVKDAATINLAINIPIKQYNNKDERAAIENLYKGSHTVVFDGETFEFNVATVLVQFETAGIIAKYRKAFAEENTVICDCGGLNVTRIVLRKGKILPNTANANAYGSNNLVDEIKKDLYGEHGIDFEEEDILEMVRGIQSITGANAVTIRKVIDKHLDEFTKKIVSDLKKDANLDIYNVFLCGGSSTIYKEHLAKKLTCEVKMSDDSVLDNVKGTLLFLETYLKKKAA